MVRRWGIAIVLAASLSTVLPGCSTGGAPSPGPDPTAATATTAAPTATTPPAATTATPAPATTPTAASTTPGPPTTAAPTTTASAPDAVAFFRAQEGPCGEFSRRMGFSGVEPDRFRGVTVVRELGNGATQIRDGRGTRLVVVPRRRIVLPASGRTDDVMPPPYEFGCSEKVFVGASHD